MTEFNEFNLKDYNSSKNLFISASAGTGKTFTIKEIVKKLLTEKKAKLEEILIVTFTEKAVGELKDRIRKEISEANLTDVDADNAPIFTIHSFCQNTLKEFSFTANKPLKLDLIDESEIENFIDRWIRDELVNDTNFKKILELNSTDSLEGLKENFKAAISKFYLNENGVIDPSVVGLEINKINGKETEDSTIENLYSKAPEEVTAKDFYFIDDDFEKNYKILLQNKGNERFDLLREELEGNFGKYIISYNGTIVRTRNSDTVEFKDVLEYFKNLKENYDIPKITELFYRKNLPNLYKAWQEEKAKNKNQSFDDMIRNIREAVREEDSGLLKQLRAKYKYAIIDEFQDTNQKQWDIFSKIFLGVENHSIIVVGDEKQSIYAFQGSDVNVFNNAREEIKNARDEIEKSGGVLCMLPTNFRSTPDMVAACNLLFKNENDKNENGFFTSAKFNPSKCSAKKQGEAIIANIQPPKLNGEAISSFLISEENIFPEDFAELAVQQIARFCKKTDGKTALQIWDKDADDEKGGYRNVELNDFAVLARTKSEMKPFEYAFTEYGIPFSRYKNPSLYDGIECVHWVSLFSAINAPDFSERNRRYLSEALFTKFFNVPINEVLDKKYDDPSDKIRINLNKWKYLASKKQWGNLIETIFEDTGLEENLSSLSDLQSLSKFRQIGDYSCDYLYKKNCSLDELINHLTRLSKASSDEDSLDGGIVARGTDFKCVQIMTIHASKGLQFPVVISAAGFKGVNNKIPQAYLYHDDKNCYLGFTEEAKRKQRQELLKEWQRLFYVDFTRAESILILPRYDNWLNKEDNKGNRSVKVEYKFLYDSFKKFIEHASDDENKIVKTNVQKEIEKENLYEEIEIENLYEEIKIEENNSLKSEISEIVTGSSEKENDSKDSSSEEAQKKIVREFASKASDLNLGKHSYSSLTHSLPENEDEEEVKKSHNLSRFDEAETVPVKSNSYDKNNLKEKVSSDYPKGARLGEVIHEIFEKSDYTKAVDSELIKCCFRNQGWAEPKEEWLETSRSFAEDTLNAKIPAILGSNQLGKEFCLKEIPDQDKITEAEFTMNSENKAENAALKNYLTGFVDLIFKREIDGKEVYSVLDWKTDTVEEEDYADFEKLKEHVDKCYSIQRVLYSYCLIKWLKNFGDYSKLSESEIFENHFGGIYYALIRGCKSGTSNGIYAHTWKSWKNLEEAFTRICEELIGKDGEEK